MCTSWQPSFFSFVVSMIASDVTGRTCLLFFVLSLEQHYKSNVSLLLMLFRRRENRPMIHRILLLFLSVFTLFFLFSVLTIRRRLLPPIPTSPSTTRWSNHRGLCKQHRFFLLLSFFLSILSIRRPLVRWSLLLAYTFVYTYRHTYMHTHLYI